MSAGAYDLTTLSERIQSQLTGIQQLSAYFASLSPGDSETAAVVPTETKQKVAEMIRIHLGDEWWADMEQGKAQAYLARKQDALEQASARSSSFARQLVAPASQAGGSTPALASRQKATIKPSVQRVEGPELSIEDDGFLFPSDDVTFTPNPSDQAAPAVPTVLAEIGQKLGTPLGLKDLVDEAGGTPDEAKVQMLDDGTVLNEEGLPFLDIREDLSAKPSSSSPGASTEDVTPDPDDDSSDGEGPDSYWSTAKVQGREELKRRLFGASAIGAGSANEERGGNMPPEEEFEDETLTNEAVGSAVVSGQSKGVAKAPAKGYMVKSTVINPAPPTPYLEELPASPPSQSKTSPTSNGTAKTPAKISSSSSEDESRSTRPGKPSRRKSVTFAPEAHVRTFEKGEAMPMSAQGVDFPDPKDIALREALLEAGVPETVLKPIAAPAHSTAKPKSASSEGGLFSGFKKGFLTAGAEGNKKVVSKPQPSAAYKAKLGASNSSAGVQPVPALVVSGPDEGESSDSKVPIAAPHEPNPPPVKRSLFARRKAEAAALKSETSNDQQDQADTPLPKPSAPMKQQVMERFSSSPKPMKKTPEPLPQPVHSRFGPPPKVPDLEEVLKEVQKSKSETSSAPSTDGSAGGDADVSDGTASLVDGEYSDDGEDYSPAGMEEKLLLRETVMAYHQQRASMGRQGLGGAVGQPEREPGIDDVDQPRSRAVGFGEKVTPIGMEGGLPMPGAHKGNSPSYRHHEHQDEDDEDGEEEDIDVPGGVLDLDSISLPTVIPGSTNLASGIRVGKLENGNLIVQAKDDSSDESEGEENEAEPLTPEELAQRKKRKTEKKAEDAMRRKLMDPDLAGLIRREAEEANAKRLAKDVEVAGAGPESAGRMIGEMPPAVRATPLSGSRSMEDEQDENVSSGPISTADKPKKISKFKAARLAAASRTETKQTSEPLRLRGGGLESDHVVETTSAQDSGTPPKSPPGPFTVHHALMLRALDLTLNCEVSQTAFSVGSIIWLPSTSGWFSVLNGYFGPTMKKAGELGVILGESWSRAIPGNTHAEQNALHIFGERFAHMQAEVVAAMGLSSGDEQSQPNAEEARKSIMAEARIYATMEPCSVRTSGLPSCSAGIVSSGLKQVYIGVEEPADYVHCEGLRILRENGIAVHHVDGMAAECLRAARRGLVDGPIE